MHIWNHIDGTSSILKAYDNVRNHRPLSSIITLAFRCCACPCITSYMAHRPPPGHSPSSIIKDGNQVCPENYCAPIL
jgi:hypothetical protein